MIIKRKHNLRIRFKLKLILLAFIIGIWVATFYPMIWLAPPLFQFTPFVYIGLSLLWIPIVWRSHQRIVLDGLTRLLIVGCIVSSVAIAHIFEVYQPEFVCRESNAQNTYIVECKTYAGQCGYSGFTRIGNIMIAHRHPFDRGGSFMYCLF